MAQDIAEIRELLKTLEYLDKVIPTEKSINALDKNTLYEIVFAHIKLGEVLENGLEDSLVEAEVKDLYSRLGVMIDLIPEDTVNELLASEKYKSMRQLDKLKYSTGSGFDGTVTKSYTVNNISIKTYIMAKLPSYMIAMVLLLLSMSGDIGEMASTIASNLVGALGGSAEQIPQELDAMMGMMGVIIGIMTLILVTTLLIGIVIDLLYIMMPVMREVLGESAFRFVSTDAKNAINEEFDEQVQFIKVREPDRIVRNLAMYDILKDKHKDDKKLKLIKKDIESGRGKKYLYALAKVEYLYDKLECA